MIWFFIAGFIAGIVGTLLLGKYFSERLERMETENNDKCSTKDP